MPSLRLDDVHLGGIAQLAAASEDMVITRELSPAVEALILETGAWQMGAMGIASSFNVMDANVIFYLEKFGGTQIRNINSTTRRQIVRSVIQGVSRGEGTKAIARRIKKVFSDAKTWRAEAIAKTEVTSASSYARQTSFEQVGPEVVQGKRWLATRDRRTRDPHRRLNGKVVPVNGYFEVSGQRAKRPGDFPTAALNVNCRCTILPVFPKVDRADAERLSEEKQAEEFDTILKKYDEIFVKAMRRAFRQQEKAVLAKLESMQ